MASASVVCPPVALSPSSEELSVARFTLLSRSAPHLARGASTLLTLILADDGSLHLPGCEVALEAGGENEEFSSTALDALCEYVRDEDSCVCWCELLREVRTWLDHSASLVWALALATRAHADLRAALVSLRVHPGDVNAWEVVLAALEVVRELVHTDPESHPACEDVLAGIRRGLRSLWVGMGTEVFHRVVVSLDAAGLPAEIESLTFAERIARVIPDAEILRGWGEDDVEPVTVCCELSAGTPDGLTLIWAVAPHVAERGRRSLLVLPAGLASYLEGVPGVRAIPGDCSPAAAEVILTLAADIPLRELDLRALRSTAEHALVHA